MKRRIFFILALLLAAVCVFAQDSTAVIPLNPPNITTDIDVSALLQWQTWLAAVIITLVNFLTPIIPGIKNISDKFLRVLTFSLVLLALWFYALTNGTVAEAVQLSISFFLSSGLIYPAMKSFGLSKKLTPGTVAKAMMLPVAAFFLFSFNTASTHIAKQGKAKERTYWVACTYKAPGMNERVLTTRVTTAYWMTTGQEFFDAVIRDLKESGAIPAEEYFERPALSWLSIVSIEPIPADIVFTTKDPKYNPKVPVETTEEK